MREGSLVGQDPLARAVMMRGGSLPEEALSGPEEAY